jgi:preprotein translocase subunit SecG
MKKERRERITFVAVGRTEVHPMAIMRHRASTLGATATGSERQIARVIAYVASAWFLIMLVLQALAD